MEIIEKFIYSTSVFMECALMYTNHCRLIIIYLNQNSLIGDQYIRYIYFDPEQVKQFPHLEMIHGMQV